MEFTLHARLPGEAGWDGVRWTFLAVCGRQVVALELVADGREPNCRECRADLGLSGEQLIPWSGWGRPSLQAQLPLDPP
jgi:hypothetical protein